MQAVAATSATTPNRWAEVRHIAACARYCKHVLVDTYLPQRWRARWAAARPRTLARSTSRISASEGMA
eukprot:3304914-Pleurochrysis_carterae.AAC.2